ncbi:YihY/virulence factor BrkB family protein [Notoacmeibacter ruber]|uniref:YihY/virulence factor BrkB family protein n=1 Tax=Notoacmeibacter ruber TaxID=2670375 RepID=A0A3L7JDR8_9HYPH|nr:YihY/virulence factor BrkB family protein [Notoacmeibacter ruber]RLQ88604.1 YihY/virulence factor BrkB family protein [Notoacmeibacter ruber]
MWQTVRVIAWDAISHFNNDDGWAFASHVALSTIMAIFPFLIFAASLAGFLGADYFAQYAVPLLFETWPHSIAEPVTKEVQAVLSGERGDLLTIGVLLALFFASNGVEALRTSLNRAYRQVESRSLISLRLQSFGFVLLATLCLTIVSLLLVAAPIVHSVLLRRAPDIVPEVFAFDALRIMIAIFVLIVGLAICHVYLPEGKRRLVDIMPGMVLTILFWVVGSWVFATYLENFGRYSTTYAGLASIIVALVFLYMVSAIFIIGAELNAAIMRFRALRAAGGLPFQLPSRRRER